MSTPVWLMDVDGVLNAVRADDGGGRYRYTTARTDHRTFPIHYDPEVIGRIKALNESSNSDPTNSGNSSLTKLKSTCSELTPAGT